MMTICRPDKILNSHPACFVRFFCSSKQNICSSSKLFLDFLQLIALVKQVRSLIDMHQVIGAGPFLYAYLREVWFVSHSFHVLYLTSTVLSPICLRGAYLFQALWKGGGGLIREGGLLKFSRISKRHRCDAQFR